MKLVKILLVTLFAWTVVETVIRDGLFEFETLYRVLTDQAPSLDKPFPDPTPEPRDCGASIDRANARAESLKANLREMSDALRQCGGWLQECEGRQNSNKQ